MVDIDITAGIAPRDGESVRLASRRSERRVDADLEPPDLACFAQNSAAARQRVLRGPYRRPGRRAVGRGSRLSRVVTASQPLEPVVVACRAGPRRTSYAAGGGRCGAVAMGGLRDHVPAAQGAVSQPGAMAGRRFRRRRRTGWGRPHLVEPTAGGAEALGQGHATPALPGGVNRVFEASDRTKSDRCCRGCVRRRIG